MSNPDGLIKKKKKKGGKKKKARLENPTKTLRTDNCPHFLSPRPISLHGDSVGGVVWDDLHPAASPNWALKSSVVVVLCFYLFCWGEEKEK